MLKTINEIKNFKIIGINKDVSNLIIEKGIEGTLLLDLSENKFLWFDNRLKKLLEYSDFESILVESIISNNQLLSISNLLDKNIQNTYFQLSLINSKSQILTFSSEIFQAEYKNSKSRIVLICLARLIDTTEEEIEKEKLLFNFKYFKTIIESTSNGVALIDKDGKAIYASDTASKILGFSNNELTGMSLSELIDEEDKPHVFSILMESLENPDKEIDGGVVKVRCKDGSFKYNQAKLINYLDNPHINAILDIFTDVSEKHLLEKENQIYLNNLEERAKEQSCLYRISQLEHENIEIQDFIKQIVDIIPSGFQYPDNTFVNIILNNIDYKSKEYKFHINNLICSRKSENDIDLTLCVYCNKEGINSEDIFLKEENVLLESIANIVTMKYRQKKNLNNLKETLQTYDYALNAVSDAIYSWDLESNTLNWSSGIQTTFQHSKEELNRLNDISSWVLFVHDEDRERVLNNLYNAIEEDGSVWEDKYRFHTGNNNIAVVLDRAFILRDAEGKALTLYGAMQDITEQQNKEEEILYHNKMLSVISKVNNNLLGFKDWYKVLSNCFEIIGEVIDVDRVYYFENYTDPKTGEMFCNQKLEWSAENVTPQIENPKLQNVPFKMINDFLEPLKQNLPFIKIVSQMEDTITKKALQSQDILSVIIFPIIVNGEYFGFIGFDECKYERIWKEFEIDFLKTISYGLSKAIEGQVYKNDILKQKNKINTILESVGDGFAAVDSNFIVTYWNKKAEELTGILSKNIVGNKVWDNFKSLFGTNYYNNVINALNTKEHFFQDKLFLDESGRWLELNVYPTADGLTFYFRDISVRTKNEIELEKLSYVARHNNDVVIISNKNKEIEWVNNAFYIITGYSFDEVIGKKPGDFLQGSETDQNTIIKIREALNNHKPIKTRILNYTKNKRKYWLDLTINPVFNEDGDLKNFIAIERDITDIVNYEINLQKINENLEDIVIERTEELEVANQELQLMNKEKDRFFGIVAHDIKNPISGIQLVSQLIQMKFKKLCDMDTSQFDKDFEHIFHLVNKIAKDLDELLEINKLQRGSFKIIKTEFKINSIFTEIINEFNIQAHEKQIELETKIEDSVVNLDLNSLEIISNNIISNAIKYSKINSKIIIAIFTDNNFFVLKVTDSGPGFLKEDLNNLYQPYKKLSAKPTGNESSSGLGLSIVKNIIELNGGRIELDTEVGVGSTFTVYLPV